MYTDRPRGTPSNQRMKLTWAAMLVLCGVTFLQAAQAAYPYRSAKVRKPTMTEGARYFKHSNAEGILGRGFCYYEFAPFGNELVAMRQIEADGQTYLTSNLPTQNAGLCDQPLSVLDSDFLSFEIEQ